MVGVELASTCRTQVDAGQNEQGLATCDRALAVVPTNSVALSGRAKALFALSRNQEAIDTYNRLLEIDPTNTEALLGAGYAQSKMQQSQQAIAFYNRYFEMNPANIGFRLQVANEVVKTGDMVSAFRILEPGVAANRDSTDYQRVLFQVAAAAGTNLLNAARTAADSTAARPFLTAASAAFRLAYPTGTEPTVGALTTAFLVANGLGNADEAMQIARTATERFPNDATAWNLYASALRQAGRHAESADALTRLIAIDPMTRDVYLRRGQAYLDAGQTDLAIADFRQAAQAGNGEGVGMILFGKAVGFLQPPANYEEAEKLLTPAVELYPATGAQRGQMSYYAGLALFQVGWNLYKDRQNNAAAAREALPYVQRAIAAVQAAGEHQGASELLTSITPALTHLEAVAARR
jgi:tetratricopeptide (TPR) repeat protein